MMKYVMMKHAQRMRLLLTKTKALKDEE
jgi:hypothetical protein